MLHPWGELRRLANVIVIWARPAPDTPAATDGERRIWLDPRMNQRERRCALTHELVHLVRGHRGCQPPAVERDVRETAARALVDWERLVAEFAWARSAGELADELWVTEAVLKDLFASLSPDERQALSLLEHQHQA